MRLPELTREQQKELKRQQDRRLAEFRAGRGIASTPRNAQDSLTAEQRRLVSLWVRNRVRAAMQSELDRYR